MKTIKFSDYHKFNEYAIRFMLKLEEPNYDNAIVLFTGNDDPVTKQSWCPDCVLAKPIIDEAINKFQGKDRVLFIVAEVGLRDVWRDPKNKYRQNLTFIPTLITLMNDSRLTGSECSDVEKVSKFIAESTNINEPGFGNLPFCKPLPSEKVGVK